jgi:hypothetical protein
MVLAGHYEKVGEVDRGGLDPNQSGPGQRLRIGHVSDS